MSRRKKVKLKIIFLLATAVMAKASFLITYNLKDYLVEKIKNKFNVLVVKPGYFIQFYRQAPPQSLQD